MIASDANDPTLVSLLDTRQVREGLVVFLTGAGISAESGIPTFRGSEGYWTIGSVNTTPTDMATRAMFERAPDQVWCWYLWRVDACRSCEPNSAHRAIAELERRRGDGMGLITQNVDGLHQRAGSTDKRSFAIHGNIAKFRCSNERCGSPVSNLPAFAPRARSTPLSSSERAALTCASCGAWMRPHVLWFDEYYDEPYYRSVSAMALAARASLLVVVGTTGSTTLPIQIGVDCARRRVPIVDVNVDDNPFSQMADRSGIALRQAATVAVPAIARRLAGAPPPGEGDHGEGQDQGSTPLPSQ
jgi:NAD-dependent deacetylase